MKRPITRHNRLRELRDSRDLHDQPPAVLAAGIGAWLWAHSGMLKPVWDVVLAVSAWPGVIVAPDQNGLCLRLGGVILGELRWNGRIDLPFGPEMRDRLVTEGLAARDPEQIDTERVVFDVRTAADVDHAVWLLRLAYLSLDSNKDACARNGGF
jgi:hypothetical protein